MRQGPEPGEYRGLSTEEQEAQNAMYRDLNDWNARAIKIIDAREDGLCSCEWFANGDPYCAVHSTGRSPDEV